MHFCARPRGNRKLRYLVGYPLPDRRTPLPSPRFPALPSTLGRSLELSAVRTSLLWRFSLGGDAEVWNPECNRHPRGGREGGGSKGGRGAPGMGQRGERSIARTCFRHRRILPTTYIPSHIAGVCTYVILSGKGERGTYVGKRVYGVSRTYLPIAHERAFEPR